VTIGFYSPLPPAPTGVADYCSSLLKALQPLTDVKVNADGDVCLYHLGNNHLHREIYNRALERPGVVMLHDAVLHHFFLGTLDREAYVAEFVFNYGEWSWSQAETLWRDRARSAVDPRYFEYAMLRRIAEISRGVVVHNPGAAAIVRRHTNKDSIFEVPHLLEPPAPLPAARIERVRAAWNLGQETFVFGIFGHLRESKRLHTCLAAFEIVRSQMDCALLVCGAFVSGDLERSIGARLSRPGIIRMGYIPDREFWETAQATDACLNLRYPTAGETSGIAIRLMGAGKPVILSATEETSGLPEGTCIRVDPGVAETEMLAQYMGWLARERDWAAEIGRRAAGYIRECHSPERAARMYLEAIRQTSND
jgi:glycosyltransferase involved in cell wall biosynthesis